MIDGSAAVSGPNGLSEAELIDGIGSTEAAVSGNRRQQLRFIREFDLREGWQQDGARHMGQWLAAHLGISVSEGLRRTKAAHALERLTLLSEALEQGILSFEKVVQLARYLDADTEEREIAWARKARLDAIKRKADVANRPTLTDVQALEVSRYLTMWQCDEFGSLGIQGMLPAAEGALFKAAIEQAAKTVPTLPDEEPDEECRQADALLALTVGRGSSGKEHHPPTASCMQTSMLCWQQSAVSRSRMVPSSPPKLRAASCVTVISSSTCTMVTVSPSVSGALPVRCLAGYGVSSNDATEGALFRLAD